MILSHHLIFTLYGWWLPNDPRGSSSHLIRSDLIAELGELHFGRKRSQPASRDIREFYEWARAMLKHELKTLDDQTRAIVAEAFGHVIRQRGYTCYACYACYVCAIMPDHVHVVIREHRDKAEEMIAHLQDASRDALRSSGLWPSNHQVWGGPGWKVYLDSADDIRRTIPYVEANPDALRMPRQVWDFVTPYDGWEARGASR